MGIPAPSPEADIALSEPPASGQTTDMVPAMGAMPTAEPAAGSYGSGPKASDVFEQERSTVVSQPAEQSPGPSSGSAARATGKTKSGKSRPTKIDNVDDLEKVIKKAWKSRENNLREWH
jgi:hypothetical protein